MDNYGVTDIALAQFGEHRSHPLGGCTAARIHYDNGYTVSVVSCRLLYSDGHRNYEVATGHTIGTKFSTHEVEGVPTGPDGIAAYRTSDEVNEILIATQKAKGL
jgi:hypothetical protein